MTQPTAIGYKARLITALGLVLGLLLPMLAVAAPAYAAPADCRSTIADPAKTRQISYSATSRLVRLEGCDQSYTLTDIYNSKYGKISPDPVVEPTTDPATGKTAWLVKANILVREGSTLNLVGGAGGDADEIRIQSEDRIAYYLRAENGAITIRDAKVTSWDTTTNAPDTNLTPATEEVIDPATGAITTKSYHGRAFIHVRTMYDPAREIAAPTACSVAGGGREPYEARMDIVSSDIGFLGYNGAEAYGLTWKVSSKHAPEQEVLDRSIYAKVDVFGGVANSRIHDNYYGVYTYGGYCMDFTGSTYEQNYGYGLDPHDDTDYLTADKNVFRENGFHGFICSKFCDHTVVTNNESYRNKGHGIMLHDRTDGALVENNLVYENGGGANGGSGIAIFDSYNAIVRNNTSRNNTIAALRLTVGSSDNLIEGNTLVGQDAAGVGSGYVVFSFMGTDLLERGENTYEARSVKRNTFRNNTITGFKSQAIKLGQSTDNLLENNLITGPGTVADFPNGQGNVLLGNRFGEGSSRNISTTNPALDPALGVAQPSSVSTIVRDAEVGRRMDHKLDAAATVRLRDSRNHIFQLSEAGLETGAGAAGSSLDMTHAQVGPAEGVTTLPFTVAPQGGLVKVRPVKWTTAAPFDKSWTESSANASGAVAHIVGDLAAGRLYDVSVNNVSIGSYLADPSGRIAFDYTGGYGGTKTFVVAEHTVVLDTTAPETTITAGPTEGSLSNNRSAEFAFAADEAGAVFECSLDGSEFGPCTSPKRYADLGDGSHTFAVRSRDAAGNVDATPATRTWRIDATAPDTGLNGGPAEGSLTNDRSASFDLGSNEQGASFQCSLDGSAYAACDSPKQLTGLADGPHSISVRSIDAAGNVDGSPVVRNWTVDATAPDTGIGGGPAEGALINYRGVSFELGSNEQGAGFECSVDGTAYAACGSPKFIGDLADGRHSIAVRARDAAGNLDGSPAVRSWTVDASAPAITKSPAASIVRRSQIDGAGRIAVRVEWAGADNLSGVASYQLQRRVGRGRWVNVGLSPATATSVTLALPPRHHTFRVRAFDAAGNASAYAAGPVVRLQAVQERSAAIAYTAKPAWALGRQPSFYGGGAKSANRAGAHATLTFSGAREVAFVTTKAANRGKLHIYLDGRRVATRMDLYSRTTVGKQVVWSAAVDPSRAHTVRVLVLGTKNRAAVGKAVDVDAFLLQR